MELLRRGTLLRVEGGGGGWSKHKRKECARRVVEGWGGIDGVVCVLFGLGRMVSWPECSSTG